ncbi:MAG TPA: L,D-transpeptidase family protein [Arenibaculum sp.]|nr:L,D-transpeptidase family protein [Arenibaculum sp.]
MVAALLVSAPVFTGAAAPVPSTVQGAPWPGTSLAGRLAAPRPDAGGHVLHRPEALRRFYADRHHVPAWDSVRPDTAPAMPAPPMPAPADSGETFPDGAPEAVLPPAAALLKVLSAAANEGLDQQDYHLAAIAARLVSAGPGPEERLDLDLLLTDALMNYVGDLRSGRVAPRSIDGDLAIDPPRLDLAAIARDALRAHDLAAFLAGFTPPHPDYDGLRQGLAELRNAAEEGGWPAAGPGPVLKPGMADASVPALRIRLTATGEFDGTDLVSEVYDAELEAAVRAFQDAMELGTDGIVGARTRAALNVTVEERIGQVAANMERLRWLPDDLGARHVVVNIPDYRLQAVEAGQVRLDMPVIVGSALRRTPVFTSRIDHMVYNPTWTVPTTIARKDILPKLVEDPGWLISQGIRVFDGWSADAQPVDPFTVDWRAVGERITRYKLRQEPGPLNALGRVKFMFPNDFDVYLHDTPQRGKFSRAVRMLSSGCVRVGDPDALAGFLFEGMPDWTPERRRQAIDAGTTRTVRLNRPVPVHLLYQTAWRDAEGRMVFRTDIYDRDRQLLAALGGKWAAHVWVAAANRD